MKCLCEALDNVDLDEINEDIEDEEEKVTPEVIDEMKNIMNDFAEENNLEFKIDEAINEEVNKAASMLGGLSQDFQAESDMIAQRDIVTSSNSSQRESPIPVNSVSEKPFHGKLDSSLLEDYPESYGTIDSNGNWEKVNKKSNQYDFVHKSGTKFSIYDNGDLVVHCMGNKKEIIEGEYILEVGKNYNISVGNNYNLHVLGNKKDMIDGNSLNIIKKTQLNDVDTAIINKTESFELDAKQSINLKAATIMSLDGGDIVKMKSSTGAVIETQVLTVAAPTMIANGTVSAQTIAASGDVKSAGVSLETHTHTQGPGDHFGSGGTTTPPIGGGMASAGSDGNSEDGSSESPESPEVEGGSAGGSGSGVDNKEENKPNKKPQKKEPEKEPILSTKEVLNWNPDSYKLMGGYNSGLSFDEFKELLDKYGLTTKNRIAGFLAQCGHESGNFRVKVENLSYSSTTLNKVFPSYFGTKRDANLYHRKPVDIANVVYYDPNRGEKGKLGNTGKTDGWNFRGRGFIQLTGKNNYIAFSKKIGKTLAETVQYLTTNRGALESALFFWDKAKLNSVADSDNILLMTKRINGGTNGLADRKQKYEKFKKILSKVIIV